MEKVYMEAPRRNTNTWRSEDISPYDFRDENPPSTPQENRNNQEIRDTRTPNRMTQNSTRYASEEDEYDMDAIMEELDRMDEELGDECSPESDMYDNGNIDWRCNEDVSQNMSSMHVERKTIVESDNPKRKTTTWMRVTRVY